MHSRGYHNLIRSLGLALLAVTFLALSVGRYSMNPAHVLRALYESASGTKPSDPVMHDVLYVIRMPRVSAAIVVGAALSVSGATYQGVFKNPLVSPDFLGATSGACVGAALAILAGAGAIGIQLWAFLGGIGAVSVSTGITRLLRLESNMGLVLSGIITSGFLGSLLGVLKYIADPETQLAEIVFWQMGSLQSVKFTQLLPVLPLVLLSGGVLLALSWRINILSFGEDEARTLGMDIRLYRGITVACASLLTASSVSLSGTIGWIGLVIPHFGRLVAGSDNTRLLPVAALMGSVFMLSIDTLSRAATSVEIPLSIPTGIVGAPLFAWLLWKQRMTVS